MSSLIFIKLYSYFIHACYRLFITAIRRFKSNNDSRWWREGRDLVEGKMVCGIGNEVAVLTIEVVRGDVREWSG